MKPTGIDDFPSREPELSRWQYVLGIGALVAVIFLPWLTSCTAIADTAADPSQADVRITYLEMSPEMIAKVGKSIQAPAACSDGTMVCRVAAYSIPMASEHACLVVLPPRGTRNWDRLKAHEERHCHGEDHPGRARFLDEMAF